MTEQSEWISQEEAASLLGVDKKTIRRRIDDGSLPAYRIGPRTIRIRRADLDVLLVPVPPEGGAA